MREGDTLEGGTVANFRWDLAEEESIPDVYVFKLLDETRMLCNSTLRLKSITVNKQKLNNKHTQRTQEFTWFGKLPTSTETTEKFHY